MKKKSNAQKHYTVIYVLADGTELKREVWPLPWGARLLQKHFEVECGRENRHLKLKEVDPEKEWDVTSVADTGGWTVTVTVKEFT